MGPCFYTTVSAGYQWKQQGGNPCNIAENITWGQNDMDLALCELYNATLLNTIFHSYWSNICFRKSSRDRTASWQCIFLNCCITLFFADILVFLFFLQKCLHTPLQDMSESATWVKKDMISIPPRVFFLTSVLEFSIHPPKIYQLPTCQILEETHLTNSSEQLAEQKLYLIKSTFN